MRGIKMITQTINELINVLDLEAKSYEDILIISKNKTKIIISGKVNELESIVMLEQALILKMAKLEDDRERLAEEVSEEIGLKPSDITVSELLRHVQGAQAEKLKNFKVDLLKTVNELKSTYELNTKLIKNSLEVINFSINLFSNVCVGNNNYGSTGEASQNKKRTFFDVKL